MDKPSTFCGLPTTMFNPDKLSAAEFKFVKTYVAAMRRDYDVLTSVLDIMDPANLGVTCVVRAAELSYKLHDMQLEFDAQLRKISAARNVRKLSSPPHPTNEDLSELFTLSFFKVITKTNVGKSDDGLFSGEPDSWKQVFKNLQNANAHEKLAGMLSAHAKFLFKLLPKLPGFMSDASPNTSLPPGSFIAHDFVKDINRDEDDEDGWDGGDVDDELDDDENWFSDNT